jgi:hypothetical protein
MYPARSEAALLFAGANWFWDAVLEIVWGFLGFGGFFNLHVAELFGVKNLATLQAFDILGVLVPGNDTYSRVFADGGHRFGIGWINCSFRQIVAVFSTIENVYLLNL